MPSMWLMLHNPPPDDNDEDDEDEFPTRPGQLPSSASLLVEYIGKFRSIPIPERDRMLCHGMHWDGKRSLTLRVRSGKQFLCFTNNIKVMTRFCLSRLKQALSVPDSVCLVLIFSTSSGGNRRGMQRIERSDQARAGLTDRLTDRLAHSYALSSDALRLSFEFNRIYKFYLCDMGAFCFVPPSIYRGMKVPRTPRPRERRSQMVRVSNL